MADPAQLTLDVDLSNPGQFLACCGMLELASRVDPESLGWFDGGQFHVSGGDPHLLDKFVACPVTSLAASGDDADGASEGATDNGDEKKEPKSPPIFLGEPFNLRVDWWEDESATEAGFKTWSAGMTILGFFNGTVTGKRERRKHSPSMREHLARHLAAGQRLLETIEAIEKPLPFNFDSRISRNVALDLGFVGHVIFAFSPAVELFALIGLQRFRPKMEARWDRNTYHTWREPLPVTIAAPVAFGLIPTLSSGCYAFAVKPRDAQGRYKAFGPALPERSSDARSH